MSSRTPQTVLVTGASSGIGRSLALSFARRGAFVAVSARREAELASLCDEIASAGGRALALPCDVSDVDAAAECVREAERKLGSLDMVVANAGVSSNAHSARISIADIQRIIDVNVRGAMVTLAAAIPIMLGQKHGHLVGVSSLAGRRALPTSAIYNASKAALSTFLEALRIDLAPSGLLVTDVQPGFVDTPLTKKNQFPMPFLWDSERAASHIADRLGGAPRILAFPLPMDLLTRVSKHVPHPLYAWATRRVAHR